jgi:hypothetical protein
MRPARPLPPEAETGRLNSRHTRFGAFVEALDHHLRRRQSIVEYTNSPNCIFRMQVRPSGQDLVLSDGTRLRPSDRIIELHFWNEHLPSFSETGTALAWARDIASRAEISMSELARHLAARPDLDDVQAICGNMALGPAARSEQIVRFVGRYGFERIAPAGPPKLTERLHRFGENILITMLVIARNAALRTDTLRRDRVMVCLSRKLLEQRYGHGTSPSAGPIENSQTTPNT